MCFICIFYYILLWTIFLLKIRQEFVINIQRNTKSSFPFQHFPAELISIYIYSIWFDFWLVKSFKKHLSLNAIMGSNHFSYPTIFLPFFGGTRDILKLTDGVFIWLPFYFRFMFQMYKCPLLIFNTFILAHNTIDNS